MTATLAGTMTVSTMALVPGDVVLTRRHTVGDDFGIPLVVPSHGRPENRGGRAVPRTVRSRVRGAGGQVVRFTDGTKTPPIHGRTSWVREEGDR